MHCMVCKLSVYVPAPTPALYRKQHEIKRWVYCEAVFLTDTAPPLNLYRSHKKFLQTGLKSRKKKLGKNYKQ